MRRNGIPFNTLLQLAEEFCAEKELNNKKKGRGRPPLYPLSLILAIWLWKTMLKLSYRQAEVILRSLLPQNLPDFSTLHYRVSKISEDLWIEFINWLARRSKDLKEVEVLLVDGTGWGYGLPIFQRIKRGEEVRKIKSHVKGVVVLGLTKTGERIVLGASLDKAYFDERNLFLQWLKKRKPREKQGLYLVGDKLYGMSIEVIKEVMKRGWIPVIKIEESLHRGIRDELRKIALKSYNTHQEIYKKRCLIESFFGTTKGMFGGYLEERTEKMAFNVVFAQLALWNIGNILFVFFVTLRCKKNFQTASDNELPQLKLK